ncbi:histidine kinase dimerization/phosphoacceptor domain -containing protein [Desulfolithobacter sp.]
MDNQKISRPQNDCGQTSFFLEAINKVAEKLLAARKKIPWQEVIDLIGPASSSSRCYIFLNKVTANGTILCSQIAEWCAEGIRSELENPMLQNLDLAETTPRYFRILSAGDIVCEHISDIHGPERDILEPQQISSILLIPIMTSSEFAGFIGFDACVKPRQWTDNETRYLKTAARLLAHALERHQAERMRREEMKKFNTVMDALDAVVLAADSETEEIVFLNRYGYKIMQEASGDNPPWRPADQPDNSTGKMLRDHSDNSEEIGLYEHHDTKSNRWYQCRNQQIRWPDGRTVRLEIATDITVLKDTELKLQESEKRYRKFYSMFRLMADNMPDLLWAKDLNRRFIFANKAICDKLLQAKDTEEPIGKTDIFFALRERAARPERTDWHTFGEICQDSDAMVMASGRAGRFDEFGNVRGKFMFLDVYKAPIRDEDGEMIGTVGCGRIVTREKELEQRQKETMDQLQDSLAEKETLLSEIHHRVKNNLQALIHLITMQESMIDSSQSARQAFQEIRERIMAMALIHTQLYQSDNFNQIDIKTYTERLITNLFRLSRNTPLINKNILAGKIFLRVDTAIPCGMIISELISNVLKYAFPEDYLQANKEVRPTVWISFTESEEEYTLCVSDNGVGLPRELNHTKSKSLGMKLVHILATHQLGGQMHIQTGNGTMTTINFPKKR